jgi:hypothetical protein
MPQNDESKAKPKTPPPSAPPPKTAKTAKIVKVREHSKELIRAFTPIRFFLMIIGQMPFDIRKKVNNFDEY